VKTVERVAALTVGSLSVKPQHVVLACHRLKVRWIAARLVLAEMVDIVPVRDLAYDQLVGDAVGTEASPVLAARVDLPISVGIS
jgi:hypothetical protein